MMMDNKQKQFDYVKIIEWLCVALPVLVFTIWGVPSIIHYKAYSLRG